MNILLPIFSFIFAILLLVSLHEFGHFWVARKLGVKVLRFSIGFGRPIFLWHGKDGTEYAIAWLPLGGYVRLLDEREMEVPAAEKHLAFNNKPLLTRFLVLVAGPLMNWVLALLLFWLIFVIGFEQLKPVIGKITPASIAAQAGLQSNQQITQVDGSATPSWQKVLLAVVYRLGETNTMQINAVSENSTQAQNYLLNLKSWTVNGLNPDPLESLGIVPYQPFIPPVVAMVQKNSPAAKAGIQVGDQIVAFNDTTITDWQELMSYVQKHPGENIRLTLKRAGKQQIIAAQIGKKLATNFKSYGFLGIGPAPVDYPAEMKIKRHYSIFDAWKPAWQETNSFTFFNFVMLGKMAMGRISMQSLGGPVTVFTSAKDALKQGIVTYFSFLAIFSTMLAAINILPIPGLDGGHILFLGIEAIRRRPIAINTQILAWRIGMIFLIAIMLQATVNDLIRLFS